MNIPYNKPFTTGKEIQYIEEAIRNGHLSGDGSFTRRCHAWLEQRITCRKALLTHSCTAALEMAAILSGIQPGDEVIMPSFTFVTTANAFVLRGAVPVFIDIRPDTLNMDETKVEEAITPRTKAIVPVHYAGVACEMETIIGIAQQNNLLVIEDAAQGIMSAYQGRPLGNFGHLAALSFHETKNVISGEGGALLINDAGYIERAEIIREKGTNRSSFLRGLHDKYTWVDIGSSYLPSEIMAAFLWAQMEQALFTTTLRASIWRQYHEAFADLEEAGLVRRPVIPEECLHNAHIFYLLLPDLQRRKKFLDGLTRRGVNAIFHYVPLHSSPAGKRYGRTSVNLKHTEDISDRLVRLPLWAGMGEEEVSFVINAVRQEVMRF